MEGVMKKQDTALFRRLFALIVLALCLAGPGIASAGNDFKPPAPPRIPNSPPGNAPQGLVQGKKPNWQNLQSLAGLPGKKPGAGPNQTPELQIPENAESGTGEAAQ